MIWKLFGGRADRLAPVRALFGRIAAASRREALFLGGAVPDSFEGRFESLTLHTFLVLHRLKALPAPAAELAQDLVDLNFAYLEEGFRRGGVSDIAVPKRMKKIAQSFYGRVQAYEAALDSGEAAALAAALSRNLGGGEASAGLGPYVAQAGEVFSGLDLDALLRRDPLFPALVQEAGHDA